MDAESRRRQLAAALRRVASGDRAALRLVYDETAAKLFGVCLRILSDRGEAEDVLQEVYLNVWRKAASFDEARASPITWLVAIARNRAIDRVRSGAMARLSEPIEEASGISDPAPIATEIGELGALVKQLADTVATHDGVLNNGSFGRIPAPAPTPAPASMFPAVATPAAAAAEPAPAATDDAAATLLAAIRGAIDEHRIDMHLQPIVTLPQRKVRYYEALTRLRTQDGHMLQPAEFLGPAASNGLLGRIDQLLLFRCVQVVRRLLIKNREIGIFCNISAATLNDPEFFPQMAQFMEANRALAPSLVLEFKQSAWRDMGPLELESLAALRELGFRFCMDQVTDLRIEPRDLAERGVRFVKASAALLLARTEVTGIDIHAADLSDLLHRHGISLIADKIETENQVVELLDYDLNFGQGFLFSPPRPVRAEALQSGSDTVLARMRRRYDADRFRRVVDALRRARPDVALTTDLIVGFPGETDADFEATLGLVAEVGFVDAYSFKYSPRPGTAAVALDGAVAPDVAQARLEALQSLQRAQTLAYHRSRVGSRTSILVEGESRRGGQVSGRDPWHRVVNVVTERAAPPAPGQLAAVRIVEATPHSLLAELEVKEITPRADEQRDGGSGRDARPSQTGIPAL